MAWLTGWNYRKQINISSQSGAGTLYQIDDPDVTDTTVDKWVRYKEWKEVEIE